MADYISNVAGENVQVIPNTTSAGAADASKMIQLDAAGKIDPTLLTTGLGGEDYTMTAFETLAAGDLVNVFDDAGTFKLRKADATDTTKRAHGFVQAGIAGAASGIVRLGNGVITGKTGLTGNTRYYLSEITPGAITPTAPSTAGNLIQHVGTPKSATEFRFIEGGMQVTKA